MHPNDSMPYSMFDDSTSEGDSDPELAALLGPTFPYDVRYAKLPGSSCVTGVFLSYLVYLLEQDGDRNRWICLTAREWHTATMISRSERESARQTLRQLGVLEERRKGIPARLWYRVNWIALDVALAPQYTFHGHDSTRIIPPYRSVGPVIHERGPNWRRQAAKARHRDQHTCQHCGREQRKPRLQVHHLRPYRLFDGDYQTANVLENLISLCARCHTRADWAFRALERDDA